ncbi:DNA-directed RNA polymeras-like proteines I and III subunit RPAC1 [Lophiotrema nucula]|uniref:DNA-directed RNA polymerases I and III subunit RPAC1 n=1 Tax=Lophiotrema nucula TaxID=690887 RepID=A0A6A5ZHV9_9PLEO|nr:DNA-directed RNA polymeras-like proteines I and III subunit RPAC1 [Lophiotrema nucula]
MPKIPTQEELEQRKRVQINAETVTNAQSNDFPHHWPGEDHSWNLDYFKSQFRVKFEKNERYDAEFSLIGLDTSVANAFRRILIAEIPTLAIETVFINQNTSIIADEVLAHRMGLVPLTASRKGLDWMSWYREPTEEDRGSGQPMDYNACQLRLEAACTWLDDDAINRANRGETDPNKLYKNHSIYAKDLVWVPSGQQNDKFEEPLRPTNPDILLVKMRPGQKIELFVQAIKGIGQDHAKFSPVATASYRLMPTIDITKPILGQDAKKFARCFPKGVIELEKVTEEEASEKKELEGKEGELKAVVKNPMRDTVSRECLRHPEFKDKVKLGRVRDHFIFKVESTGQWDSDLLFLESVKLLKVKCERVKRGLDAMMG